MSLSGNDLISNPASLWEREGVDCSISHLWPLLLHVNDPFPPRHFALLAAILSLLNQPIPELHTWFYEMVWIDSNVSCKWMLDVTIIPSQQHVKI